jgi:glycosyltransferase involved in cell wall biosynthesis
MLYFTSRILPIIIKRASDVTLTIAGQRPTEAIKALAGDPAIRVTGYVDDIRETARDCGVFIVPLRSGSGVRVKILNALAMGLPIVSTSIGVEGLAVENGKHLLIADRPEHFAAAVLRVLSDPALAGDLGANARRLACERYSWEAVGEQLLGAYGEMMKCE